ncbi:carbohydrate ABC transporter permease [Actinopolymorpha rutila]|uniref:ABC-type glycerol-3-phosphate transport system permease component n=1 Tax=Actinopolymorpha rutila TaxID=446787 RepID=A0A852ZAC6_9ACTN|nr:carbohydrate ABC transporter permease [Actinopolymorpha rutila]NYH89981.1 ABC-type glycerol-3-phosphate transport system permease component [Actinopolymorpha rutila]
MSDVATRKIAETRGDRIFDAVNVILLTAFLLAVLYPVIYVVSASFSDANRVVAGDVILWPVKATLEGYYALWAYHAIVIGYLNSVFYSVVGTAVNLVLTVLAGYALSRKDLYGRNFIMAAFVFTMLFEGGIIPTYLVVHDTGLLNTRWALIVPTALSVFNVIITRTFFQVTIPDELLEAARVDGCDDFRFLWKIVLPLSKPIIAVNVLFYGVGHWNEFFNALIYLTDEKLFPLQLVLREVLIQNKVDPQLVTEASELLRRQELQELLKYSLIMVAIIPPLIAYPFVQKHFVKGVMIGSLKG